MKKHICIHGHFYQPPRENPWLSTIEKQDSAYPYHDWNERITAECYAPNAASRILDGDSKITEIVNNYSKISFNFGATLLSWLECHRPDVYEAVLEADRESMKNFSGHGAAIAQVYNHIIMPLANRRDRETQIKWGIEDFKRRFKRMPEGMWLAETAADNETLELLAENGIKFTILAPNQAKEIKEPGSAEWTDVSGEKVDPRRPYKCVLGSGKEIALFFYDGPVSRDLGFGDLLKNGDNFANRLLSLFSEEENGPELAHVATDGETYGHHQKHGEMALAYCIHRIEKNKEANITIYGEYFEKFPPVWEARIFDGSSWSCVHGVERWKSACGCNSGMNPGWKQEWRAPLRRALDMLSDRAAGAFEQKAPAYLKNPWEARNDYIDVMSEDSAAGFFEKHAAKELAQHEVITALKLLEMQKNSLFMYTSCGWFFDEISGIETTQIIKYGARVLQLLKETAGVDVEADFVKMLAEAPSNIPEFKDGAKIYDMFIRPSIIDLLRVGVHFAVTTIFREYPEDVRIYSFEVKNLELNKTGAGRHKFSTGKAKMRSLVTAEEETVSYAVLHLGDHNLIAGVRDYAGDEAYGVMKEELLESFSKGEVQEVIKLIEKHFESHSFSLWHLFRDEQEKILNEIFEGVYRDIEGFFRQIYENNYTIMQALKEKGLSIPKPFISAVEFVINEDIKRLILDKKPTSPEELGRFISEVKKWGVNTDRKALAFVVGEEIAGIMEKFYEDTEDAALLEKISGILKAVKELDINAELWRAQNLFFRAGEKHFEKAKAAARTGDESAKTWIEQFVSAGESLGVRYD
ncbi:MAG TPA: DUF3536 domain-containing protein [bacterium]|nr:DUF3536 domain-containing protein [bacterium]